MCCVNITLVNSNPANRSSWHKAMKNHRTGAYICTIELTLAIYYRHISAIVQKRA